jgi:hypothetical protein
MDVSLRVRMAAATPRCLATSVSQPPRMAASSRSTGSFGGIEINMHRIRRMV